MAAQPSNRLQSLLQTAVQTVQWTYSLFWQLCPQQGILVWGDGYYNGAIKTRKTVMQSLVEVSAEEDSIQRSRQLIELYESLSAGESINNQQTRWPCAALSPEDLTESEWFYLMCVSFSFPLGVGVPGKAYAKRQHIWLIGANEVDSKVFSRAILAKSAHIQTVVCIPLADGVLELGSTERVQEDIGLIHQIKSLFNDHHPPQPPKPTLSGHSTSNSATLSELVHFRPSPPLMPSTSAPVDSLADDDDDDDEEEEEEEEGEQPMSHSVVEPSELIMKLDMSEDIRLGSPDDGDSNFQFLFASREGKPTKLDHQRRADSHKAESTRKWPVLQDPPPRTSVLPPPSEIPELELEVVTEEEEQDTHYSQTLSTILQRQHKSNRSSSSMYSFQSAFSNWTLTSADRRRRPAPDSASQWLLKYILFTVPFLHAKEEENSPKLPYPPPPPQDEVGGNHVLAERRRREKLNERFVILRSLVPFVTKMDKASILGDTIEYVKQLRNKVADLEARVTRQHKKTTTENPRRKLRIVEEIGSARPKPKPKPVVVSQSPPCEAVVQVSIIERNVLVEIQSGNKEGLLLDVMVVLRKFRVEVTAVQSSVTNGVFVAELRAKVRENVNGKKPSIVEVKAAIDQIIPQ